MGRVKKLGDGQILASILEVIIAKGATQFSLEDLSVKTGLSPSTLLQRFGSKKKILQLALELANQQLKTFFNASPSSQSSWDKLIIDIYLHLATSIKKPKEVADGLDILKLDITDKHLNKLTREYFELRREKIQSILETANIQDPLQTTWDLECLWQGSIMLWAMIGEGPLNEWLERRLKHCLLLSSRAQENKL